MLCSLVGKKISTKSFLNYLAVQIVLVASVNLKAGLVSAWTSFTALTMTYLTIPFNMLFVVGYTPALSQLYGLVLLVKVGVVFGMTSMEAVLVLLNTFGACPKNSFLLLTNSVLL
jgi:hypothetical protein